MIAPPYTGNSDLDSFLYNVYINGTNANNESLGLSSNNTTGEIKDSSGNVVGYLYQFIHIKYADSNTGINLSNSPTNKAYYGIRNSNDSTESTNPADYTWYEVPGTFGTTRQLYYYVLGGRQIKFDVNTEPIDYKWLLDSGAAISLDTIVPPKTIGTSELLDQAITELKIADAAVTASKTNVAAISNITGELVANSVGTTQITDNAITSEKITANAITAGKIAANAVTAVNIEANSITSDKILAGSVTSDKINVSSLAAINATLGSVSAGTLDANTITVNGSFVVSPGSSFGQSGPYPIGFSNTGYLKNIGGAYIGGSQNRGPIYLEVPSGVPEIIGSWVPPSGTRRSISLNSSVTLCLQTFDLNTRYMRILARYRSRAPNPDEMLAETYGHVAPTFNLDIGYGAAQTAQVTLPLSSFALSSISNKYLWISARLLDANGAPRTGVTATGYLTMILAQDELIFNI